jgi:hypothetical protein
MNRIIACAGLLTAGFGFAMFSADRAQADPAMCTFLGQNYNVQYDCLAPQPWLPYGTGNNPPLGGSAVTPGGDGPSGGYHWQPNSPACPACSS